MNKRQGVFLLFFVILFFQKTFYSAEFTLNIFANNRIKHLDRKYKLISEHIGTTMYGKGALVVLKTAYKALKEGYVHNKYDLVGLEDLWVHALKEGYTLFNKPNEKRWGYTGPQETLDMLGQTTIGPWQITTTNIQNIYGIPYGVKKEWTTKQLVNYCVRHPEIQAKMIADYIQNSYTLYGKRSPYAIQNYFWLEAYLKNEIGQGNWYDPVLVNLEPGQTWKDITDQQKRNTGFYAKQILLGSKHCVHGLLYWLYVTESYDEIKETLSVWKKQKRMAWDYTKNKPVTIAGDEDGYFEIRVEDIIYCECHPEIREGIMKIVKQQNEQP